LALLVPVPFSLAYPRGAASAPYSSMFIIANHLSRLGHGCLIYEDDMVIFSPSKFLNQAIEHLNSALKDLKIILTKLSLEIASEKCKTVIFTRCRYFDHPYIYLDDYSIPFATNVTYLESHLTSNFVGYLI